MDIRIYVDMYKKCHTESNGCVNSQSLIWFSRQHTAYMIGKQMLQLFVYSREGNFMINMINTCLSKTATKCNYMHFIVHMMHTHWFEVFRVQYQNMQIYKSHSECIRIIPTLF